MLVFYEASKVTYIFHIIMRTVSEITKKKMAEISGYTLLANNINFTEEDITGRAAHVQVMFSLKDEKTQGIFSGT